MNSRLACHAQSVVLDVGGMASVLWSAALARVLQRTMLRNKQQIMEGSLSARWCRLSCFIWGFCLVLELILLMLVYEPLESISSRDVVPWCNAYVSANWRSDTKYVSFYWYVVVYAALAYCVATYMRIGCTSHGALQRRHVLPGLLDGESPVGEERAHTDPAEGASHGGGVAERPVHVLARARVHTRAHTRAHVHTRSAPHGQPH